MSHQNCQQLTILLDSDIASAWAVSTRGSEVTVDENG